MESSSSSVHSSSRRRGGGFHFFLEIWSWEFCYLSINDAKVSIEAYFSGRSNFVSKEKTTSKTNLEVVTIISCVVCILDVYFIFGYFILIDVHLALIILVFPSRWLSSFSDNFSIVMFFWVDILVFNFWRWCLNHFYQRTSHVPTLHIFFFYYYW